MKLELSKPVVDLPFNKEKRFEYKVAAVWVIEIKPPGTLGSPKYLANLIENDSRIFYGEYGFNMCMQFNSEKTANTLIKALRDSPKRTFWKQHTLTPVKLNAVSVQTNTFILQRAV